MVHNSSKRLENEVMQKIYQLFFTIINKSSSKNDFLEILTDFISPEEQIMIAKRIAIAYLLLKGINHTKISYYLGVSSATVAKFALLFYQKETKSIKIIKSLIKTGKALAFIEDIFAELFIQPGFKRGHWSLYSVHKGNQIKRKMLDV